jgi:CRISPR/Cas system-associated exonuclease Cas4 (RecB family)
MEHRGEIVEKVIRQSGYPITKLAKKIGKTARWMYYQFENHNMPIDYILQIGNFIHYDFSNDIKDLKKYNLSNGNPINKETNATYLKNEEINDYWKDKYLALLEKYNALLQQNVKNPMKRKIKKK